MPENVFLIVSEKGFRKGGFTKCGGLSKLSKNLQPCFVCVAQCDSFQYNKLCVYYRKCNTFEFLGDLLVSMKVIELDVEFGAL